MSEIKRGFMMNTVMDGNEAVAYISYAFTEAAVVFPITPSATMAEKVEKWSQENKSNIFQHAVRSISMQSESGVAGAMHGLLKAGTLATTYTCSQGLLLMGPTLYKMVGELLPAVIHVSARSLSSSALCIYGDHTDVMAIRQTGAIMLSSATVQQAAYIAAVAHLVAIETKLPVIHFFEGFDTSHEMQKITLPLYEDLRKHINVKDYEDFKEASIRNDKPRAYGSSQTPDIFFQQLEVNNQLYLNIPGIVQRKLRELGPLFQQKCSLVDYIGPCDAEIIIVLMGSVSETVEQVINEQNNRGKKYGLINVHLFRPFPLDAFLQVIPKTVRTLIVLDRTKENGSIAEPLLLDVQSACYGLDWRPTIIGGRYGLGSKDVTPDQLRAVYFEAEKELPKKRFTIGIRDEITNLSIEPVGTKDLTGIDSYQAKIWGFGSDGAVSCSRQTVKIIGANLDKYVQGKFWYDPRKSGNLTISHLRFSNKQITSRYCVSTMDIVSCYCDRYLKKYNLVEGLRQNGILLINTSVTENIENLFPEYMKREIAKKDIKIYTIPANEIATKCKLGRYINTIMQTCFFELSKLMEFEKAKKLLKKEMYDKFNKSDPAVVSQNYQAIDLAIQNLKQINVPLQWRDCVDVLPAKTSDKVAFYEEIQKPMLEQKGNHISVGTLLKNGMKDGSLPLGTTAIEKRGITSEIPIWDAEDCIQCNLCSVLCPHAAIRPFIIEEDVREFETVKARGLENKYYRIQVSPMDCTGCSICQDICPVNEKALRMEALEKHPEEKDNWEYMLKNQLNYKYDNKETLRESQFQQPLLEFSGACAGCGETAYVKLLTQLFGDRLIIANATGCSSIWGCSAPSVSYTTNDNGQGPVWGNSLLENNAEYGYGMHVGAEVIQTTVLEMSEQLVEKNEYSSAFNHALLEWCNAYRQGENNYDVADRLTRALLNEKQSNKELEALFKYKHYFYKRCQWIIGGDGWAYDIGSSGIDHILSQSENINILVLDNEGYSNTGGQPSKATPKAARMKFASSGKKTNKKNMALFAMHYDNVYVAQISIGANPQQTAKAFDEAEKHNGPSLVIAYSPCVLHGIGEKTSTIEEKKAVEVGYWPLFRFHSNYNDTGESKMFMDSKPPKWDGFRDFLTSEKRFYSLLNENPAEAERLFLSSKQFSQKNYQHLSQIYNNCE